MGAVVVALMIIGFLVLFSYLKFPPRYAEQKLVKAYNMMVLGVCAFLCLMFYLSARVNLPLSPEMREPVAIAGALAIEIVFLGICFLLRNFWVFKPPRRPGSGFGF